MHYNLVADKSDETTDNYDITTLPFGDFSYLTSSLPLRNEFNMNAISITANTPETSNVPHQDTSHDTNHGSDSSENNDESLIEETVQVEVHAPSDETKHPPTPEKPIISVQNEGNNQAVDMEEIKNTNQSVEESNNDILDSIAAVDHSDIKTVP